MEAAFLAYLLAVAGVADIVGDRGGWDWLQQGSPVPAFVLTNIDGPRGVVMSGYDGFVDGRVQCDIWSATVADAIALRNLFIPAFAACNETNTGGVVQGVFVEHESSGFEGEKPDRLFRTRLMLRIPHAEA